MVLPSKYLFDENTYGILNKHFSYSEGHISFSNYAEIAESFPVLFCMPKFKSSLATAPTT
jgi:hypothetical protein